MKKTFTLSKLQTMAVRRRDWLFDIMEVGDEFGEEMNPRNLLGDSWERQIESQNSFWGIITGVKRKTYDEMIMDIRLNPEYAKKERQLKNQLKSAVQKQYTLVDPGTTGGMYKDYEFIIQDNDTKKYYAAKCDNYGGANWPPVTYTEI